MKSPRAKVLLSLCVAIGFTDVFAILEGVARDSPVSSPWDVGNIVVIASVFYLCVLKTYEHSV